MISTRHRPLMFGAFLLPRVGVLRTRLPRDRQLPRVGQDRDDDPGIETLRVPQVRQATTIHFEHEDRIVSAAFSSDLTKVVTGSDGGKVRVWDLTGSAAAPLVLETEAGGEITGVAFSLDGARLAAAGGDRQHLTGPDSQDGIVRVWNLADPAVVPLVLDFEDSVTALAFSPDGRTLATATWNGSIRLQDLDGPRSEPIILRDYGDRVFTIAFSPDGATLASNSGTLVLVWDLTDPAAQPLALVHSSDVYAVAFNPDGTHLATGIWLGAVLIWELADRSVPSVVLDTVDGITSVAWSPDGATLAAGCADETVWVWRPADLATSPLKLHPGEWVVSVAFSTDGAMLATCGQEMVRLWDMFLPDATPTA